MKEIIVEGGKALRGTVVPQGSKNAALPIIFAAIATGGVCTLSGVPDIEDVSIALKLTEALGARVTRTGKDVTIDTGELSYVPPDPILCSKIRASTYLIGASLARFGRARISTFGGCNFDSRPIDMHVYAAECLGAITDGDEIYARALHAGEISFDKVSVGATVNAIIMAASTKGTTVIKNAACEPHIIALEEFLVRAGATIKRCGTTLTVSGGDLHGASAAMIPDMIEAGTYLLLAPLTDGDITVAYPRLDELECLLSHLEGAGVFVSRAADSVRVRGVPLRPISVRTAPYPEYPTDLQPQMSSVMAAHVGGRIEETVWHGRFGYLKTLGRFGVLFSEESSSARIYPSLLHSAEVDAIDLRGTAASLMVALAAEGVSKINNASVLLRGYENPAEKLRSLGADVTVN